MRRNKKEKIANHIPHGRDKTGKRDKHVTHDERGREFEIPYSIWVGIGREYQKPRPHVGGKYETGEATMVYLNGIRKGGFSNHTPYKPFQRHSLTTAHGRGGSGYESVLSMLASLVGLSEALSGKLIMVRGVVVACLPKKRNLRKCS